MDEERCESCRWYSPCGESSLFIGECTAFDPFAEYRDKCETELKIVSFDYSCPKWELDQ